MSHFGNGSIMWLVNRERLVLLGGPAAAVLQVAHPVVALGVAHHSSFTSDTLGRLHRTLEAVYVVAFGTPNQVTKIRQSVAGAHRKVQGSGYSAFDPEAQLWVLATLIQASVGLFERFVRPLSLKEKDQFLRENRAFGRTFGPGSESLAQSWGEFSHYWEAMMAGPILGSRPECGKVARAVVCPTSPIALRALAPVLYALTNEFVPAPLRKKLDLPETIIQKPVWAFLDYLLPTILPFLPENVRFAPQYLEARKRESKSS